MALHDYSPADRDALVRTEFVKATNRIIPGSVLAWYQGAWQSGPSGPSAVLLDIWENQHYHPEQIPNA